MTKEYEIGDIVKITDNFQYYPNYPSWFEENASEYLEQHEALCRCDPNTEHTFKIIKKAPKLITKDFMLYLLQDMNNGDIFLFNVKGFKEAQKIVNNKFDDLLFQAFREYLIVNPDHKKLKELQSLINDLLVRQENNNNN